MTERRVRADELIALLEVGNELSRVESFDDLCRRAVELARRKLGFDRIGIWFKGDRPGVLAGSFGVDEHGHIRDERGDKVRRSNAILARRMRALKPPGVLQRPGKLFNDKGQVVGRGTWNCTALWCGNRGIGYVFADNLLTGKPVNTELLALFAATFGHLCALKTAQTALRKSERRFRELWDNAPVAYHTLNRNGQITGVNKTEAAMLGYAPRQMVGRSIFDFVLPEQRKEARERFLKKVAGHAVPKAGNRMYVKKNGTPIIVSIVDKLERDVSGRITGVRTTMMDVTEQREAEETIKRLAYTDTLTGLPNRRLFMERLAAQLAKTVRTRQPFAVMLLDLDYFKRVNDSLGHNAGDRLLKRVGERLTRVLRQSDTVARMGGDEFLILLPHVRRESDACAVAGKLLDAVAAPFSIGKRSVRVTTSIGLTVYPRDGRNAEALLTHADTAMYAAKKAGRHRWVRYARNQTANGRKRQ